MKTCKEYRNAACSALKGNWIQAVLATVVLLLISEAISIVMLFCDRWTWSLDATVLSIVSAVSVAYAFLVAVPASLGYINSLNMLVSGSGAVVANMKEYSLRYYWRHVVGYFFMTLMISLYSLLLIVPGIILSFAYFPVPFLLRDKPELSVVETLALSRKMMKGHKMQVFKLQLSFIGWVLLSILTMGIGMVWLMPYMVTAMAAFYQDIRNEYETREVLQESAL